jgi:hypothetical protein
MCVLNPVLYGSLCRHFGADRVRVVYPGVAMVSRVVSNGAGDGRRPRFKRQVDVWGEAYEVCCPFCRDEEQSLRVNHMFGVDDPETGGNNIWAAQCFNRGCLTDYENRKELYYLVYGERGGDNIRIRPGRKSQPSKMQEVEPPGPLVPLHELAERQPDNYALTYLRDRHYDPVLVGQKYDVSYCPESHLMWAQDRICASIHVKKKKGDEERQVLVGWQCRHIGDDIQGRSFEEMDVPKYFTCPGMSFRAAAYNMELALQHPTVVVVEGMMDVWRLGPQAMALWGRTMHPDLARRVARTMKDRWGRDAAVVVMLDPKRDAYSRRTGEHPIAKLTSQFISMHIATFPVWLPEGSDPASFSRQELRAMIREEAEKDHVHVTFARKPSPDDRQRWKRQERRTSSLRRSLYRPSERRV